MEGWGGGGGGGGGGGAAVWKGRRGLSAKQANTVLKGLCFVVVYPASLYPAFPFEKVFGLKT